MSFENLKARAKETKVEDHEKVPYYYFKERIVTIVFTSKGREVHPEIILERDNKSDASSTRNTEEAFFIHTFSCLNLFRHKYITECYDINPKNKWLIIPDYKENLIQFLSSKPIYLKIKAIRQIFKLALFFESMKLQDYYIELDELYYEDFGNSFCIKFHNFSGSWFGETGKFKIISASRIFECMERIIEMLPEDKINDENLEEKRENLERILLFDTIPMKVVDDYVRNEKPEKLWYFGFIRDLIEKYISSNCESSFILRKISNIVFSKSLRKAVLKL